MFVMDNVACAMMYDVACEMMRKCGLRDVRCGHARRAMRDTACDVFNDHCGLRKRAVTMLTIMIMTHSITTTVDNAVEVVVACLVVRLPTGRLRVRFPPEPKTFFGVHVSDNGAEYN